MVSVLGKECVMLIIIIIINNNVFALMDSLCYVISFVRLKVALVTLDLTILRLNTRQTNIRGK